MSEFKSRRASNMIENFRNVGENSQRIQYTQFTLPDAEIIRASLTGLKLLNDRERISDLSRPMKQNYINRLKNRELRLNANLSELANLYANRTFIVKHGNRSERAALIKEVQRALLSSFKQTELMKHPHIQRQFGLIVAVVVNVIDKSGFRTVLKSPENLAKESPRQPLGSINRSKTCGNLLELDMNSMLPR